MQNLLKYECACPNCGRNLAATRFAPHLEKCMGMGRNSSRVASRRIANYNGDELDQLIESTGMLPNHQRFFTNNNNNNNSNNSSSSSSSSNNTNNDPPAPPPPPPPAVASAPPVAVLNSEEAELANNGVRVS